MAKLKASVRFLNVFDGKIYDAGDVFESDNPNDIEYLVQHKIATIEKEVSKPKKENKKED